MIKGLYMLIEIALRYVIHPRLRARLLGWLGADIGSNVRIYEITLFNLDEGFKNLHIADDVHIGTRCLLDLKGSIHIAKGATLSPGVTILTHNDPGSNHDSPLCQHYPPCVGQVEIGSYSWIGSNATLLCNARIGDGSVIAAASLVKGTVPENVLYAGVPAVFRKQLDISKAT